MWLVPSTIHWFSLIEMVLLSLPLFIYPLPTQKAHSVGSSWHAWQKQLHGAVKITARCTSQSSTWDPPFNRTSSSRQRGRTQTQESQGTGHFPTEETHNAKFAYCVSPDGNDFNRGIMKPHVIHHSTSMCISNTSPLGYEPNVSVAFFISQ